jgi:hypothetical protein
LSESYYSAVDALYIIKYLKNQATVALTSVSGVTVTKTGGAWVTYQPATSETRYSLKSEPDSSSAIDKLRYEAAKGKARNKVTITTKTRHGLATGDIVDIFFTLSDKDDKTQKIYGGRVTVTSVGDLDQFTYTLIKGKHEAAAPTESSNGAVDKKGTVIRLKHSVLQPPHIAVPIEGLTSESIQTGGSTVTIYSPDHDINVGDYIAVSIDDSTYASYSTTNSAVPVTATSNNYFRYECGAPTIAGDVATVSAIKYVNNNKDIRFLVDNFNTYTAVSTTAASITFSPDTGHVTLLRRQRMALQSVERLKFLDSQTQ